MRTSHGRQRAPGLVVYSRARIFIAAGRGDQPGIGHQALMVEDHPNPVQVCEDMRTGKVPPALV